MSSQALRFNKALSEITEAINSGITSSEMLLILVKSTARALAVRGCSIMLLDAQKKRLFHVVSRGLSERYLKKDFVESEKSLIEVTGGRKLKILDAVNDPHAKFHELARSERIVSILGVPLKIRGDIVGTLRVYSRTSREFTSREEEFLAVAANLAGIVLEVDRHSEAERAQSQTVSGESSAHIPANSQLKPGTFAHPSEEEFARLLDFYQIDWLYEPRSFVLDFGNDKGNLMFTPDFYLPGLDMYIEITTMKSGLTADKNRKIRRLRELHPEVNIKLLARRDYDHLLAKYGYGPLGGTKTRGVGQVVFSAARIQRRVRQLSKEISGDYEGRHPVLVGVLRGVFCFMADLMRNLTVPADVDFMSLSYYQAENERAIRITEDLHIDIEGRHVLLVEDIVDTGMTLRFVLGHLREYNPASLTVCTLFDKKIRRLVDVPIQYAGFESPDEFLIGYGLDYREEYRNLPFVALLEKQV